MAELVKTFIEIEKTSAPVTFTAATGSDFFVPDNADGRVALIIKNGNAQNASVTLEAGDGGLSPLGGVKAAVGANETVYLPYVRAESARVKVTAGADRGKVFVTTAVDSGGSISGVGIGVVSVE